jgi:hypothetical protein
MALTRDDVRALAREELKPELEALAEANKALARAVERLSIVTTGDPSLGVSGMLSDVTALKADRQENLMVQAKRAGVWLAVTTVGGAIVTGGWMLVQAWLDEKGK